MDVKIKIDGRQYEICKDCEVYRKPQSFKAKKQKRKSCSNCRSKK